MSRRSRLPGGGRAGRDGLCWPPSRARAVDAGPAPGRPGGRLDQASRASSGGLLRGPAGDGLPLPAVNTDAHAYHLARVEHWVQAGWVGRHGALPGPVDFSTLVVPVPDAEAGDRHGPVGRLHRARRRGRLRPRRLRLARRLGLSGRGQAFTALLTATLPNLLLEATSTTNNLFGAAIGGGCPGRADLRPGRGRLDLPGRRARRGGRARSGQGHAGGPGGSGRPQCWLSSPWSASGANEVHAWCFDHRRRHWLSVPVTAAVVAGPFLLPQLPPCSAALAVR